MSDDKKVIFSMSKVSKTYTSTNKQVLKDIYLSFFYGAKIGILGLNGSGKSSLLRIIAGVDKNHQGDVVFAPVTQSVILSKNHNWMRKKQLSKLFVKGRQR